MGVLPVLLRWLGFLGVALGGSPALHWDSTSCFLDRPIPGSPLRSLSFLGKDAQGAALYHAHWDARRTLRACSRQDEPELTAVFAAVCAHESTRGSFIHTPGPELQRALNTLRSQWDTCREPEERPAGAREKRAAGRSGAHQRRKRGWTMPGTLWCGVGDSAGNSSQLGIFRGPDLCCREHDLCPQNISPLQYNYGIRNYRFHTISHCDCDARFRQCLRNQRDSISDIVGVAFFNVLEIPCFVLEEQEACVAWYWWGGCRKYGSALLARLQPRTQYNASWNSPATSPTPSPQPPAATKPQQKQHPSKQQKGSEHPSKANVAALQASVASPRPDVAPTAQPGSSHPDRQGPQASLKPRGPRRACRSFRRLDQCEHQIGPQETKFQLHNAAQEPLFHCNCTRRLARNAKLHGLPADTSVLWELLGTTCFKLAPPLVCAEGKGCSRDPRAIKVSARHLRRLQQRLLQFQDTGTPEGQVWPSEDTGAPVSFYDQCLKLTQAAQRPDGRQKSWSQ